MHTSCDENTIKEFVAENRDHLEEIEPDLLALEHCGGEIPPEIINRVFRAIHSIKGSSGFFSFTAIKQLSHIMENVLVGMREGRIPPGPACIDALLASVDKLRIMFADVEKSDKVPYSDEQERLNDILTADGKEKPASREPVTPSSPPPPGLARESEDLDDAVLTIPPPEESDLPAASFDRTAAQSLVEPPNGGAYLYALWYPEEDTAVSKESIEDLLTPYGECLFQKSPLPQGEGPAVCLFATVMETDLLCEALGIPESRVLQLDTNALNPIPPKPSFPHRSKAREPVPAVEDTVRPREPASAEEKGVVYETIRVHVDIIDTLMNLAGELVLGRNQLRQELGEAVLKNPKLGTLIQGVDMVTSEVQEKIMQMRMQPVGNLFTKFTRVVRDLSRQLDKEVDLVLDGYDVELDKSILEGLSDPMTHLLRNSMDHGIEGTAARAEAGKPPRGVIHLRVLHEGGQVSITIRDDGRGIDPEEVAKTAVAKGILTAETVAAIGDKEKLNLILMPGFSTAKTVSEISGRGVGMDVVRTNIEKLGGHLDIDSEKGKCTTVRIRLPLTLAIIPSLIVGAGGHRFAIPQAHVKELVCIHAGDVALNIEKIAEAEVLRLREHLLPLVRLTDILDLPRTYVDSSSGKEREDRRGELLDRRSRGTESPARGKGANRKGERREPRDRRQSWHSDLYVVVLRLGDNRFGLCVEELFDTEEIVVKPLSKHVKNVKCFSGATIMGDGRVAMILDAAGIAEFKRLRFSEIGAEERRRREEAARRETDSRNRRSILLFNGAPDECFALPIESISRLEKVERDRIHRVGPHEFMDYHGVGLPLLRLERCLPVTPVPQDADEMFVIIPKSSRSPAGILVSRIQDTVETNVSIGKQERNHKGLLGSAFLEGRLTLFLDAEDLLSQFEKIGPGSEIPYETGTQ